MATFGDTTDNIIALLNDVAAGVSQRDAERCMARFASDARSVTADGTRSIGRDAIRAAHVAAFAAQATAPPRSVRFPVLDLFIVRPDLAIVTTGAYPATLDDEVDLDHPPTVVTWTLVLENGVWTVLARQFTPVR